MQVTGRPSDERLRSLQAADVIARTGATTELLFAASQIDRRLELEPGMPPIIADAALLDEVLVRLVASAVQFSAGERVTIGGARFGERVELWVSDEALAIDEVDKVASLDGGNDERPWADLVRELRNDGTNLWFDFGGTQIGTTVRLSLPTTPGSGDGE